MCISTTETIQTILALALTSHRYVVAQPSVLVSTGVIRKMKKAEVQHELRSRVMNVSGTVTVLKGRLLERVQREKRGAAKLLPQCLHLDACSDAFRSQGLWQYRPF